MERKRSYEVATLKKYVLRKSGCSKKVALQEK